jgi:7,8-dihydroneopterin aldolase/epimerase/oxygenase
VTDRIEVRGLRVEGIHGVLEQEQVHPQPFEVDLDLYLDTAAVAADDNLDATTDYGAAVDAAVAVIAGPPRRLLESLADAIARSVLEDPRIDEVTVVVRKLRPPLAPEVASTGVRIRRHRRRGGPGGAEGAR